MNINIEDIPLLVEESSGAIEIPATNGSITILGHNGVKGGYRKFYIKCSICAKDPEMYGDGVFRVERPNAKAFKGCACTGSNKYTEDQVKVLVTRRCKELNYSFLGWVGGWKGKSKTYLKLSCSKGHTWETTSCVKFLDCGRGCGKCAGNVTYTVEEFKKLGNHTHKGAYKYTGVTKKESEKVKYEICCPKHGTWFSDHHHHIIRKQGCPHPDCKHSKISTVKASDTETFIKKAVKVHKDKYDYSQTEYCRSFQYISINCNTCNHTFLQKPADHLGGNGCPICAGRNQKQVYIFNIYHNGNLIALKSGIANYYRPRLYRQNKKSVYDVCIREVYEFADTTDCKSAERYCIDNYDSGFLTKEEYPDGYCETYPVADLNNIKETVKIFGGKLIEL